MTRDAKKSAAAADRRAASPSGLPIEAVVTANDLPDWDAERDLGYPGRVDLGGHPFVEIPAHLLPPALNEVDNERDGMISRC